MSDDAPEVPEPQPPWGIPAAPPPSQPVAQPGSFPHPRDIAPSSHSTRGRASTTAQIVAVVTVAAVVAGGGGYALWHFLATPKVKAQPANPAPPASPSASGSAPATPQASTAGESQRGVRTSTGWDNKLIHPVTAPVAVGGVVAVYTADGGELTLRGIDPVSGGTKWSVPASVASNTPGQPFEVATSGSTVFYYAPSSKGQDGQARMAALDAASGRHLWTSPDPLPYTDMPELCSDKAALCESVYTDGSQASLIRVDLATGAERLVSRDGGRSLGVGVEDPGSRNPEYIEHIDDSTGGVVWKDPVNTLMDAKVSSDNGWNWDSYGDVYVGYLGTFAQGGNTMQLGDSETVGVRASDGRRLWKAPGLYGCPAQGLLDGGKPIAVRCVVKGTATVDQNGGDPTFHGLDVRVQGFDVDSGKTLWDADLGDAPSALGLGDNGLVRLNADVFAITDASGRTKVINLKTGAVSAPTPATNGWCFQNGMYTLNGTSEQGNAQQQFSLGRVIAPCTASGKPAAPSDGSSTGAGATVGGYFVWSSIDGLHAFKTTGG